MPIVLATFVLSSDVPHNQTIFNAVFFVVVVSTLVQGTTLEWVAERLGLLDPGAHDPDAAAEVGAASALDVVEFIVADNHAINGSAVRELGLPRERARRSRQPQRRRHPAPRKHGRPGGRPALIVVPRRRRPDLEDVFTRWRRMI